MTASTPQSPAPAEEVDELAQGLQTRDGRFILRLVLRFGVIVLLILWLFLSESGTQIATWAADGFGTLTGQ